MKLELTTRGIEYLTHCLEGGPSPEFCKFTLGNGTNAGADAIDLSNPVKDIEITEMTRDGNFVTLTGVMNNSTIEERFKATEIGVYITDHEDETGKGVILFAYGYSSEEEASVIPSVTDYIFETVVKVHVYVGATEDVTAIIADSMVTATKAELHEHTNNNNNPHEVTAEQVGLGNVENKSIDDQTPAINYYDDFDNIQNGMTMSQIIGRLATSAKVQAQHLLDKDNPHKLTSDSIGASPKNHNHSALDITTGVLNVARGGTGVTSISELVKKLEESLHAPVFGTYIGDGTPNREIQLDFEPRAVLVVDRRGRMTDNGIVYGGICTKHVPVLIPGCPVLDEDLVWTTEYCALGIVKIKNFIVSEYGPNIKTNTENEIYHYIAFR